MFKCWPADIASRSFISFPSQNKSKGFHSNLPSAPTSPTSSPSTLPLVHSDWDTKMVHLPFLEQARNSLASEPLNLLSSLFYHSLSPYVWFIFYLLHLRISLTITFIVKTSLYFQPKIASPSPQPHTSYPFPCFICSIYHYVSSHVSHFTYILCCISSLIKLYECRGFCLL